MRKRSSHVAAMLAASAFVLCAPAGAEAAGLFDFLFGSEPAPRYYQPRPTYSPDPLEMTVRPRRGKASSRARSERRPQRVARTPDVPIDPKANPNWHLDDPTLRRGDIVVLRGKVLVFDGGRAPRTPDDFTALSRSRLVSKAERERIGRMAGLPTEPADAPKVASSTKEVALRVPE